MGMWVAVIGLVVAAGMSGRAADDDAAAAAKKLEGTYVVVEYFVGGEPNPKGPDRRKVVIKDNTLTFKEKDGKDEPVKFKLDPSKKPARFYLLLDNKADEDSGYWIYELRETKDGTELMIAANIAIGKDKVPLPTDFKGEKGVVFRLRKQK